MKPRYWQAIAAATVGVGTVVWGIVNPSDLSGIGLVLGAGGLPIAVVLAISGRLESTVPVGSVLGGATIGPLISVLSHTFVFAFAYFFFLGFAEEAVAIIEAFRIDPALVEVAGSPWTLLLFFELVLVAPLTEEVGKGLGAWAQRPNSRREAFMAGVAAGVGFAVLENILYASSGFFFGPDWQAIAAVRMLGAAVHPLASGLVVLGWWEWRQSGDAGWLARRFLTGAGVHALWNGSTVMLGVVGEAYGVDQLLGLGAVGVVYMAGLGALAFAVLWRIALSVDAGLTELASFDGTNPRTIGAWLVLAASMLIPVALLFIAYPEWVG